MDATPTPPAPNPPADPPESDESPEQVALWARLAANPEDKHTIEALLTAYAPVVRSEVTRARAKLPRHVDMDELEGAALEALFMAIKQFKPELGVPFKGYAHKRIWGAMVDHLRSIDGIPRTARRASKLLNEASKKFAQRTGRQPVAEELAAEAGISNDHLLRLEHRAQISKTFSLDATTHNDGEESSTDTTPAARVTSPEENPLHKLADAEMQGLLVQGLKELPDRERSILVLYYHEGIMFNEIAAAMEISESRVSQMHSRALERLKRYITNSEAEGTQ